MRHGVDFVVVGGTAGSAHGSTYPSYDLDVVYSRDRANIGRLVGALEEIGVRLRGAPDDVPFILDARTIENGANFTFETPFGDFDILGDAAGMRPFEKLFAASEEIEVGGLVIRVASISDLIAMKSAANRSKDKVMVEEYITLAEERKLREQEER